MLASLVRTGLVPIGVLAIALSVVRPALAAVPGAGRLGCGGGSAAANPVGRNERPRHLVEDARPRHWSLEPGGVGQPRVHHHRDQFRPKGHYNPKDSGIDPSKDIAVHEWRVMALDKNTGRVAWSHTAHRGVPKVKRHVKATQANASPVTDGRFVVVSFGSEGLYTYDMNGKLLWKQDLGILDPGYAGQPDLQWGFATSPVIHGDLVILQCDIQKNSFIVAFNLKDGTQAWRTSRDEIPAWSTPVIYQGKTRTQLVTSGSKYYRGYDPLNGKELWRLRDDTQVKVPSPVIAGDLFFLSGGNPRGRDFYAVRATATGDISISSLRNAGLMSRGGRRAAVRILRRRSCMTASSMSVTTTECSRSTTPQPARRSIPIASARPTARSVRHRLPDGVTSTFPAKTARCS